MLEIEFVSYDKLILTEDRQPYKFGRAAIPAITSIVGKKEKYIFKLSPL
jgi:hypothetical protein